MRDLLASLALGTDRVVHKAARLTKAVQNGLFLGLFTQNFCDRLNGCFYDGQTRWASHDFNRRGLLAWEERSIPKFFNPGARILLVGAGGGREIVGLSRLGYAVDGYECSPRLVALGNRVLAEEKISTRIQLVEPNECPSPGEKYEGLIVGWGTYMHIMPRARRLQFLRQGRQHLRPGAPLLVSFGHRAEGSAYFESIALVANLIRRTTGREPIEVGDRLDPNAEHVFTRREVESELEEGGFRVVHFDDDGTTGCAIGVAVEDAPS